MRCPAHCRYILVFAGVLATAPLEIQAQRAAGTSLSELSLYADVSMAEEKSSGTAALLSLFLPGVGQFYNEEYAKGALMLLITTAGVVMAVDGVDEYDCDEDEDCMPWLLPAGAIITVGNTIWSVIDASAGAKRWNRRHGAEPIATDSIQRLRNGRVGVTFLAAGF